METKTEEVTKVFVKIGQSWHKADAVSIDEKTFKVRTPNNGDLEIKKDSKYLELQKFAAQRFAVGDAKKRLEGAYISFDNLPDNIQDNIVKGSEYLHEGTYPSEGKLKESIKMVQMTYSSTTGSKLDVQIKRNNPITLEDAKAYNHKFTAAEFDKMLKEGKFIAFTGANSQGETFPKLAYYEPKLNDIRTKSALSNKSYIYGTQLTQKQADILNNGGETQMTIDTKKGKKTYMVSYSPRAERPITKSVEQSKMNGIEVKQAAQVESVKKKKSTKQAMSL